MPTLSTLIAPSLAFCPQPVKALQAASLKFSRNVLQNVSGMKMPAASPPNSGRMRAQFLEKRMTLLKFSDVSLAFGAMPLLDKVSWQIAEFEQGHELLQKPGAHST